MMQCRTGVGSPMSGGVLCAGRSPLQGGAAITSRLVALLCLPVAPVLAQPSTALAELSFEQLGSIEISSVSKKEEALADAAASVFVITRDDIRRSGATLLPEVLRLAPNLQVAQIRAYQYAISARGFNSSTANKLLVLIDGRLIYTPLYSGVFWDAQDVAIDEIERIEVISGPGGTLWGANAVNGVINVITRAAGMDEGTRASLTAGNLGASATARLAGRFDNAAWRVYAKADRRRATEQLNGASAHDSWSRGQVGFRVDMPHGDGKLTLQGDGYRNSIEPATLPGQHHSGANLLARWSRKTDSGGALELLAYVDHVGRNAPASYTESQQTGVIDIQYALPAAGAGHWLVGAGHRHVRDHVGNVSTMFAFLPAKRRLHWTHAYANYEHRLTPTLKLDAGLRLEHNSTTGLESMPSLKLAWKFADDQLLWLGLARPVRTPSRIDTDFYAPPRPPSPGLAGGPGFRSETARALDLGWRGKLSDSLQASVTAFHADYEHLRGLMRLSPTYLVLANPHHGRVTGAEGWFDWRLARAWQLQGGLLALRERFGGVGALPTAQGYDPRWQWRLASVWELAGTELAVGARGVDRLRNSPVPAYRSVDVHWGAPLTPRIRIAVTARNLLDRHHLEFQSSSSPAALPLTPQVGRELTIGLTVELP